MTRKPLGGHFYKKGNRFRAKAGLEKKKNFQAFLRGVYTPLVVPFYYLSAGKKYENCPKQGDRYLYRVLVSYY